MAHLMADEIEAHLKDRIIPFWEGLADREHGGFTGWVGYDLVRDPKAEKGCILNSRILWFFSNAYMLLKEEHLREHAEHAYKFLRTACVDGEYGGVYWSVTYDGRPLDTTKHTYNQAFAIYALSSYYDAVKDEGALALAKEIQHTIETRCTDEFGYLEAFDREFEPMEQNEKLSENGVNAEKTMNTLLHVFEAYTELYRVTGDEFTGKRLRFMMDTVADRVYNPELGRQEVFFDREWNSLIDLYSYGHDIEASWLIDRGLAVLDDPAYTAKLAPITAKVAENILDRAWTKDSLANECGNGVVDTTRVWWVQAETVVGFLNAWQKAPEREEFLRAARNTWEYIKKYMVDSRPGSEWFWSVREDGTPIEKPIVEPWKCPYHNGRMCMEVIKRLK